MNLISSTGDDGEGHHAGVVLNLSGFKLELIWHTFFADECAVKHDADCNAIDWKDPEESIKKYRACTAEFHRCCDEIAMKEPSYMKRQKYLLDSELAYQLSSAWGEMKYQLSKKGVIF